MKKTDFAAGFTLFALIILGAFLILSDLKSPHDSSVVMVEASVGLERLPVYSGTSAYEMERASEHFSDVVLGWAVGPSFREEMAPTEYSAERQEKQNLLFKLYTDDVAEGDRLIAGLNDRLSKYNDQTHAGYELAVTHVQQVTLSTSKLRFDVGVLLLIISLACVLRLIYGRS